jgi:hypothetical protein
MSLPSAGPTSSALSFLGAVLGVVALIAGFWWLVTPEGLPVPDESYVNEKNQFAMTAPPQWITLTTENYREALQKLGNRFPKNLQSSLDQHRIEVGFLNPLQNADFSPNINVVIIQSDIPELDESQMEEGTKALVEVFSRMLDSYTLEKSELLSVDDLSSLHFTSRAALKLNVAPESPEDSEIPPEGRPFVNSTPAQWKTFELKLTQTLVPGKKRGYIITCTAEASQFSEYRRIFESAIESFRVLERPSRFGPIVVGALQGGLTAAVLPLVYFIITWLVGYFKR